MEFKNKTMCEVVIEKFGEENVLAGVEKLKELRNLKFFGYSNRHRLVWEEFYSIFSPTYYKELADQEIRKTVLPGLPTCGTPEYFTKLVFVCFCLMEKEKIEVKEV